VTDFPGQEQTREKRADQDAPDPEFVHLVRGALAHLYDPAYLQNHPLVYMLDLDINHDRVTRAQGVRRVLLECIEALRPEARAQGQAGAVRAYAILTYRCVDGLSMQEIAGKLALSRRQAYREHGKGVKAVASLLWDRMHEASRDSQPASPVTPDTTGDRLEAAQAEVARLRQAVRVRELLNLRDVLEGVFDLLAPLTQQTGVQMKMSSPGTWPSIVADRVMLRQALLNLLSHALYLVRGDLVITASRGKNGLSIDVCEAPGPAQAQPVPPSSPQPDEVGLAVARGLIEAQGGHLETRDREGRWQARIALPPSGKATILVVDDNVDIVALFQRYLAGHDVSVVGAMDGEQALSLAVELQPQVITLDVMMPSQDGWEILQRLKSSPDTKQIPIIVCSVLNEPRLAVSMGASEIITKPVRQVELLEVLQRWVGPLQAGA
jgi:CheY-like chemotaxis protein